MSTEAKYRFAYTGPADPVPHVASHRDYLTLAGALSTAWTNRLAGGRSLSITRGELPVMSEEELRRAFERLDEVERERPGRHRLDLAEQYLKEMGLE